MAIILNVITRDRSRVGIIDPGSGSAKPFLSCWPRSLSVDGLIAKELGRTVLWPATMEP